jgi:hypothetical protein
MYPLLIGDSIPPPPMVRYLPRSIRGGGLCRLAELMPVRYGDILLHKGENKMKYNKEVLNSLYKAMGIFVSEGEISEKEYELFLDMKYAYEIWSDNDEN